jgi:fido (protein-threonine AMPylation protein)
MVTYGNGLGNLDLLKKTGVKSYMIPTVLNTLLGDSLFWIEHKTYESIEIAVRFKHRLVSIHCFSNGNGSHSRLMADSIIEKLYNQNTFSWGGNNLTKKNTSRDQYIKAIKLADNNELLPLNLPNHKS